MAKMDEFLLEYYRRLIFQRMPIEQFVQFCEYVDKGELVGNRKDWANNLLEKDADGKYVKNNKLYVRKSLPDPEELGGDFELSDEEWDKLFKAFQDTFRQMDANKKSFKYVEKANKFLNQYFGSDGQLFSYAVATAAAEAKIAELIKLLQSKPRLEYLLRQHNLINDDFSYKDLLDGLNDKKYNKDPKFKARVQQICGQLEYDAQTEENVRQIIGSVPDFSVISSEFENKQINPSKLREFKGIYSDLLKELYTNKDAFEAFSANDSSKISKTLNEAKERVDYNNKESEAYIPPKREDELSMPQRISEWWDTTFENYLDKYVKLHGDRMYFSPAAKLIVKALDKEKIKPTDGLEKVLSSASAISDKLKGKSTNAAKQFKWFTDTLTELKNTMPKAFAGALKNGTQMRALVQEIILKAVRDGKMNEAKTAMEVLSVIKYGYTTSKIMDALGKTDLTIFSDKNLSWNKNDGVKFIMTALDRSIKTAMIGVGYGVTIVGNMIRLSGSKFNNKSDVLDDAWMEKVAQNESARNKMQNAYDDNVAMRAILQETLDNMDAAFGLNEESISEKRAELAAENNMVAGLDNRRQNVIVAAQNAPERIRHIEEQLHNAREYSRDPSLSDAERADAENQVLRLERKLQSARRDARVETLADGKRTNAYVRAIEKINERQQRLDAERHLKELRINEWNNAKESVKMLDAQIAQRDKKLKSWDDNHKNQYMELMAFWDFLETGRNTHTGPMYSWALGSAKGKQKAFDSDAETGKIDDTGEPIKKPYKEKLFNDYMASYGGGRDA